MVYIALVNTSNQQCDWVSKRKLNPLRQKQYNNSLHLALGKHALLCSFTSATGAAYSSLGNIMKALTTATKLPRLTALDHGVSLKIKEIKQICCQVDTRKSWCDPPELCEW